MFRYSKSINQYKEYTKKAKKNNNKKRQDETGMIDDHRCRTMNVTSFEYCNIIEHASTHILSKWSRRAGRQLLEFLLSSIDSLNPKKDFSAFLFHMRAIMQHSQSNVRDSGLSRETYVFLLNDVVDIFLFRRPFCHR